ncbi:hypothetical protein Tco_0945394 [Tanacetum coccineum]
MHAQSTMAKILYLSSHSICHVCSIIVDKNCAYNMANENVPSSFTATTETTSTLPPPPPPPQQSTVHRDIWGENWVSNSLVHSLRALSTLRRSGLRTASTAAKPCQGDSSEFYLITGNLQYCFRNSDACYHDPEKCEHAGPKVTTSHGGNTTTRMIWRFTMADDLKRN